MLELLDRAVVGDSEVRSRGLFLLAQLEALACRELGLVAQGEALPAKTIAGDDRDRHVEATLGAGLEQQRGLDNAGAWRRVKLGERLAEVLRSARRERPQQPLKPGSLVVAVENDPCNRLPVDVPSRAGLAVGLSLGTEGAAIAEDGIAPA